MKRNLHTKLIALYFATSLLSACDGFQPAAEENLNLASKELTELSTSSSQNFGSSSESTKVCIPSHVSAICSVDGKAEAFFLFVTDMKATGETTSNYSVPARYTVKDMKVQWTCTENGWEFSHPNGNCELLTSSNQQPQPQPQPQPPPPQQQQHVCGPAYAPIICTIDGVAQGGQVLVNDMKIEGYSTSSITISTKYKVEELRVQWTCTKEGWKFSHPNGGCFLSTVSQSPPASSAGTFCNREGNLTAYICNQKPADNTWVDVGSGCYHKIIRKCDVS